jgi:hypothetical protein
VLQSTDNPQRSGVDPGVNLESLPGDDALTKKDPSGC